MPTGLFNAAVFVILISTLVFVHELGHFVTAKLLKVRVLRFSIGFGPKLIGFKRGETEYWFSLLPFGGYVKMSGENPAELKESGDDPEAEVDPKGFLAQAPWKRAAIAFAGPLMSLAFPILPYFMAFQLKSDELSSRIGGVEPGYPAWQAGLREGDRIVSVEGEPIRYFEELKEAVAPHWDRPIRFVYERAGVNREITLTPTKTIDSGLLEDEPRGVIGISQVASAPVIGVPSPDSPAWKAGLRTFDRILTVNGQPVRTMTELQERLRQAQGPIAIEAKRDELRNITATLEPGVTLDPAAPYVFRVEAESAAAEAGIEHGDRIVAVNGDPFASWAALDPMRASTPSMPIELTWERNGVPTTKPLRPRQVLGTSPGGIDRQEWTLGLSRDLRPTSFVEGERIPWSMSPGEALAKAARTVPEEVGRVGTAIGMLVTGKLSSRNIGGPIMLYQAAARTAERGAEYYFQAMAFISINLGLMNLLPIPMLDGFQILTSGVETVRRRPVGIKARLIASYIGVSLLAMLMLLALKNDFFNFILTR